MVSLSVVVIPVFTTGEFLLIVRSLLCTLSPPHCLCLPDFHVELSSHCLWYTPGSVPLTFCGVIFGGHFAGSFSSLSVVYFLPAVRGLLWDSFPLLPMIYVPQIVSQMSLWGSLLVVAYCSGVEHRGVSSP